MGFCEGCVGFEFGVLHLAEFEREREGKVGFLAENERDREQGVSFKREREMGY